MKRGMRFGVEEEEEEKEEGKAAGNRNERYIRLLSEVVSPKVFNGFGCSTLNQPRCSARIALPTTPATILSTCSIPAQQIHITVLPGGWKWRLEEHSTEGLTQALTNKPSPTTQDRKSILRVHFSITMKKMVWSAMLRFMLYWLIMHAGDMFLGSYACLANGTTRSFLCLGSKVHQMPCQIPKNTTYV